MIQKAAQPKSSVHFYHGFSFTKLIPCTSLLMPEKAVTALHSWNINSCHFVPPLNAHPPCHRVDSACSDSKKSSYSPYMLEEKTSTITLHALPGFLAYSKWTKISAIGSLHNFILNSYYSKCLFLTRGIRHQLYLCFGEELPCFRTIL